MTRIRWTVLLGVSALITVAVMLKLPIVAMAQEIVQGVYWKPGDLKTSYGMPRVSSVTQPAPSHKEESFPNPYEEIYNFLRIPNDLLAEG